MWCVLTLYNLCNHNFFSISGKNIKYFCIKIFQKLEERSALVEKSLPIQKKKKNGAKFLQQNLFQVKKVVVIMESKFSSYVHYLGVQAELTICFEH